jgi:hypothetical protein
VYPLALAGEHCAVLSPRIPTKRTVTELTAAEGEPQTTAKAAQAAQAHNEDPSIHPSRREREIGGEGGGGSQRRLLRGHAVFPEDRRRGAATVHCRSARSVAEAESFTCEESGLNLTLVLAWIALAQDANHTATAFAPAAGRGRGAAR